MKQTRFRQWAMQLASAFFPGLVVAGVAHAGDRVSDAGERVQIQPVGRLFFDHARYYDLPGASRGTRPTDLRLGVEGDLTGRASYEFILEVADAFRDGGDVPQLRVVTFNYLLSERFNATIGQHDEPFSLENFGNAANMMFMERGLPVALVPRFRTGALLRYERERGGAAAGVFERRIGPGDAMRGPGVSARAFASPIANDRWLAHVGGSLSWRAPTAREYGFDAGPESALIEDPLIETGTLAGVRRYAAAGLEGFVQHGPTTLQAEYISARLDRTDGRPNPVFAGQYVSVSHFLTGERRNYDPGRGVMGELEPAASTGAIEVAVRVSRLDLNSADVQGGLQRNTTFGINWTLRQNVRLMANYVAVTRSRQGVKDYPRVLQCRFQVTW
jgi:phosphate-selective porin OprO and OprP